MANPNGSWGRGSFLALMVIVPLVASCAAKHEQRLVSTRTVTVEEQTIPPPKMVDISIVNLHGEPALDPAQEKVVGTIVNSGDRQVTGLSIRVDALDENGRVVNTIVTPQIAHPIDPNGGRSSFEAVMPRDSAVTEYHAVAIAR